MKVVFDANIFISALVFPGGQAEKAMLKSIEGKDTLLISREIINEVLSVLAGKFGGDRESLSRLAVNLSEIGRMTETKNRITFLSYDPDNRVLECASSGGAYAIITGDKAMLGIGKYGGARIMSLKEYLRFPRSER
ncbi:MAG: putative toxin-antitoxin system toxin component, PIN family [Nitrospiraceae bacterium]|nr:putative toxin-antitoxin system toxin component, PIN family [Nitrospiraceae bacterium]